VADLFGSGKLGQIKVQNHLQLQVWRTEDAGRRTDRCLLSSVFCLLSSVLPQCALGAIALIWITTRQPPPAIAGTGEPDAPTLVQAVRKSENWIHEVNSLYIRIESKWTTTPEGIAAEAKQEDRSGGRIQSASPQPSPVGILEYVIDHERKRVRYLTDTPGGWYQLKIWDGKQLTIHEKSSRHNQENYYLNSKIPERTFHEFMAVDTSWPRSQPHSFWFDVKDTEGLLKYWGPAEDFILTGRTKSLSE
jgi:hypothetical protein